jgi:hypothetical protein
MAICRPTCLAEKARDVTESWSIKDKRSTSAGARIVATSSSQIPTHLYAAWPFKASIGGRVAEGPENSHGVVIIGTE